MPKWFGYVRVSSIDQARHGHSIDAQISALSQSYERTWRPLGYEMGEMYVDAAVSASTPIFQRTAGHRLKTEPEKGDVVEFTRLDRAFRSTHNASATWKFFRDKGVGMSFLDMPMIGGLSPTAKFFYDILSAFAELDLSMMKERRAAGVAAAKKKGVLFGNGWKTAKIATVGKVRKLVPDPKTLEVAQFVIHWVDKEGLSFQKCCDRFEAMKFPSIAEWKGKTSVRKYQFVKPGTIISPRLSEVYRLYQGGKRTIRMIEAGKMPTRVGSWTYDPDRATRSLAPGRGNVTSEGGSGSAGDVPGDGGGPGRG